MTHCAVLDKSLNFSLLVFRLEERQVQKCLQRETVREWILHITYFIALPNKFNQSTESLNFPEYFATFRFLCPSERSLKCFLSYWQLWIFCGIISRQIITYKLLTECSVSPWSKPGPPHNTVIGITNWYLYNWYFLKLQIGNYKLVFFKLGSTVSFWWNWA